MLVNVGSATIPVAALAHRTPNAELFESLRPTLLRHAYRMLGSRADAEDVVQDAYVRRLGADGEVRDERAFAQTIVTRLCLDRLGSARQRHEAYVGPWLPEPFVEDDTALPERAAEIADDVSFAFMLALERLTPAERAAFLLHDVLDVPFGEIAVTLARSEPAVRRLASRGREHVREAHRSGATHREEAEKIRRAFLKAVRSDDVDALKALFAQDAVMLSDGGGKALAAIRPLHGPDRIAKFFAGIVRKGKKYVRGIEHDGERSARFGGLHVRHSAQHARARDRRRIDPRRLRDAQSGQTARHRRPIGSDDRRSRSGWNAGLSTPSRLR